MFSNASTYAKVVSVYGGCYYWKQDMYSVSSKGSFSMFRCLFLSLVNCFQSMGGTSVHVMLRSDYSTWFFP